MMNFRLLGQLFGANATATNGTPGPGLPYFQGAPLGTDHLHWTATRCRSSGKPHGLSPTHPSRPQGHRLHVQLKEEDNPALANEVLRVSLDLYLVPFSVSSPSASDDPLLDMTPVVPGLQQPLLLPWPPAAPPPRAFRLPLMSTPAPNIVESPPN